MLTSGRLRELVRYEPETGTFWAITNSHKVKAGAALGRVAGRGYVLISIAGKSYYAHRLAILYVTGAWPAETVDHVNGAKTDNRFSNLRAASHGENSANTRAHSDSLSGVKGVYFDARRQKWCARIMVAGKTNHLGQFDELDAASEAYAAAATIHHGAFARSA